MFKEEFLQELLKSLYEENTLAVYDYAASTFTIPSEEFANTKFWADQLVRDKLAAYTDTEHTQLQITNFGKFWMMKGGYESFLKYGESTKKPHKDDKNDTDNPKINLIRKEKEELIEARLKLTHYRLVGFWLALVISSIGFILSLYNLYLIMQGRK